ncbi:MAG: GtrA family protein [Myxococcales bacterium]|nr:GtrA family protein [Myxococcales bacterium]MCB9642341.1 GtrA family protein [Myxococcales bacterium]
MSEKTPMQGRWKTFAQFLLFGLIGGSGVFVDTAVLILCDRFFQMDLRLAAIPAFLVAVSWNYELNRLITFRDQKVERRNSYVSFVLICAMGLGVRILSMHVLMAYLGMTRHKHFILGPIELAWLPLSYIANFVGIFNASLFNFLGSKYFAFAQKDQK